MLGSQALDTMIGLALMFFVLSTGASVLVEVFSRLVNKRAKELRRVIGLLLASVPTESDEPVDGEAVDSAATRLESTAAVRGLAAASGDRFMGRWRTPRGPSYLSARAFAEGAGELIAGDEPLPAGLEARLEPIVRTAGLDALAIRAELERWFDEAMERASGLYKRWASAVLFAVGLGLAIVVNASTFDVAQRLWNDTTTRTAVAEAATQVTMDGIDSSELESVAAVVDELEQVGLPVGWTEEAQAVWHDWISWRALATAAGWLATALLLMLGAEFWFDLLQRLVSLRNGGAKPPPASSDDTSATSRLAEPTAITRASAAAVGGSIPMLSAEVAAADSLVPSATRQLRRLPNGAVVLAENGSVSALRTARVAFGASPSALDARDPSEPSSGLGQP